MGALWGGEAMFELLVAVHHATTFTSLVPVEETNFVWNEDQTMDNVLLGGQAFDVQALDDGSCSQYA